ncbi:toprim domain-containing protein [Pseudoroseomonas cervicalis]|uniref:DUF7146 domain-containing protein n=1 Tax=Teichococcus cervicalis TaxID=204525 RepID=UPI0022F17765|nr:toprim domain-containing protein [Pseudoroseomonas cervicalis]WBV44021.1 toprim domain-containing protein [Pseudoroseomonas cervicalis]
MTATASEIAERLGLRRAPGGVWRGACPSCAYGTTFVLRESEGRPLWWCASCSDKSAVTSAVLAAMGPGWAPPRPADPRPVDRDSSPAKRTALARRLWEQTVSIFGTPAEAYLRARGVWGAWRAHPAPEYGDQLGFHPTAPHPAGAARFPCLVALVRRASDGEPVAIHRTYLQADGSGKALTTPQKATLAAVAGGVVMLHGSAATAAPLVLGEGIETCLAASALVGGPAWAALSAGNLATLPLPALPAAADIVVAADHDGPGEAAASAASARWRAEGRRVRVAKPNAAGRDFADILLARLRAGETPHGG